MTHQEAVRYWLEGAEEAWKTAKHLYKGKRYDHSLFFVHLTIEKVLKAVYIDGKSEAPPLVHNLSKLAKDCALALSEREIKQLDEISKFNISARYEDIKLKLYKKATSQYTKIWLGIAEEFYRKFKAEI